MAIILHKNIVEDKLHAPKGFNLPATKSMSYALRSENDIAIYQDVEYLPAAINFVDGNSPPPTLVLNDIYAIIDGGGGVVDPAWGAIGFDSWNRYDGSNWVSVIASDGFQCYDKTAKEYKTFNGSSWVSPGSGGGGDTIFTGGTMAAASLITMAGFDVGFIGGGITIEGVDFSAANHALIVKNNVQSLLILDNAGGFSLGENATYGNDTNVSIGKGAAGTGVDAIAIGRGANAPTVNSVSIGTLAKVLTNNQGISIGYNSSSNGGRGLGIGVDCTNDGIEAISLGYLADSDGSYSLAMGARLKATNVNSIIIGGGSAVRTNSTAYSFEVNLNEAISTIRIAKNADSWINTNNNFGIGLNTGISAKLTVKGTGSTIGTTAFLVQNSLGTDLLEVKDNGAIHVGGVAGFTGTGAYTNFTVTNGIITAAS
tara:strand:+ start:10243 stop:11523 length:1281 start_codon:yes stop_codon:yes gene_type:complete